MLKRLLVKNIATIEALDLSFQSGLTVLTGETGAGKSMLLDALALALGERADFTLLRHNTTQAVVEATFQTELSDDLQTLLTEQGVLLEEDEITLRRTLQAPNKSQAFINGQKVTRDVLLQIGQTLADIQGQHAQQVLLQPTEHAPLLNMAAKAVDDAQTVQTTYANLHQARQKLEDLQSKSQTQQQELTLVQTYVQELEEANYEDGEEETLTEERTTLLQAVQAQEVLQNAMHVLEEQDIAQPLRLLTAALPSGIMPELQERLHTLLAETTEIQRDLSHGLNTLQADPERLQIVDDRLAHLKHLARKHRVEVKELNSILEQYQNELTELEDFSGTLEKLEKDVQTYLKTYQTAAQNLTQKRKACLPNLIKQVEAALADLHMSKARFGVDLTPYNTENANGAEQVVFMVSANPGTPLQPLVKVASGGEVSRLLLALQQVLLAQTPPRTIVLDELDTGIGGTVAAAAGKAMQSLAQQHQVMAITHQPQVAACGQTHLHISKQVQNNSTKTQVKQLELNERTEELARMLAGTEVTAASRTAAAEMLAQVA